jgi:uncharacterized protein (TIGR04255 family)
MSPDPREAHKNELPNYSFTTIQRNLDSNMSHPVLKPPYANPPIIEAVLAFHFSESLKPQTLERFARQLKKQFPVQEQMLAFTIDPANIANSRPPQPRGFKITNADAARVLVMLPETISVIRLPPYTRWEDLLENAKNIWAALKKITGHPPLARLSVRYINRIDIKRPAETREAPFALAAYFNLGLILPQANIALPLEGFHLNCQLGDQNNLLRSTIQFAAVPSPPLIDHIAFTLDIDVSTVAPLPMRDADMWTLAETLRQRKNAIFEASITDQTRSLFA